MRETEVIPETVHPLLERTGGTTRAKKELIGVLRVIMESFVDRAFGVDAVQHAIASPQIHPPPAAPAPHRRNRPKRSGRRWQNLTMHTRTTKVSRKRRTRLCRKTS